MNDAELRDLVPAVIMVLVRRGADFASAEDAVLDYLKGVDAGAAADPADVLAAHPELAGELERFFTAERLLRGRPGPPAPILSRQPTGQDLPGMVELWCAWAAAGGLTRPGAQVFLPCKANAPGAVMRETLAPQRLLARAGNVSWKFFLQDPLELRAILIKIRPNAAADNDGVRLN